MEEARRDGGAQGAEEEEVAHREKTPGKQWQCSGEKTEGTRRYRYIWQPNPING
jgi:hypothetical protein